MKYLNKPMIAGLLIVTGLLLLQSGQALAFNPFARPTGGVKVSPICNGPASGSPACKNYGSNNPFAGNDGVIVKAALLVTWVVGVVSVVIMAYAGLQFIMSRGDAQKAVNARNTILYAAIGLVVAILAQALVAFFLNHLF